jgi:hypothetical protein
MGRTMPSTQISGLLAGFGPDSVDPAAVGALLYLDPGTGSLLFSIIIGIASTAYFVGKELIYRLSGRVRLIASPRAAAKLREAGSGEHEIVFYSEGRQYETSFKPLLQQMSRRGLRYLYLTSDPDDPLLALAGQGGEPLLHAECIGSGPMAWARLRTLRAKLVCMTTPGLDVLQIRRSPHVGHYMHIVHSPTDKSFNRPYSFDFFDSVLINGPHQERVLRSLEGLRARKAKDLHMVGCLYYDSLVPRFAQAQEKALAASAVASRDGRLRVLLAPTWGKNGLLSQYGVDLIRGLADADLEVVVRPHPQSARSEADLLTRLRRETGSVPNCTWDYRPDPVDAMAASDILVSDISGIVFDYAFLTGRPVLTLDFAIDKRGFEAMDLPFEPWEIACLDVIGRRIGPDDVPSIRRIIEEEAGSTERTTRIRELRDTYVVNFGHAAEAAGAVVAELAGSGRAGGRVEPTAPFGGSALVHGHAGT